MSGMNTGMEERILKILERVAVAIERNGDPEVSLTTEEAGRFLKVSAASILRFKEAGLPHYQTKDHGITFRRSDLILWREKFKTIKGAPLKLVANGK